MLSALNCVNRALNCCKNPSVDDVASPLLPPRRVDVVTPPSGHASAASTSFPSHQQSTPPPPRIATPGGIAPPAVHPQATDAASSPGTPQPSRPTRPLPPPGTGGGSPAVSQHPNLHLAPDTPQPFWPEVPNLRQSLQWLISSTPSAPAIGAATNKAVTVANGPVQGGKKAQHVIVVLGVPTPDIGPLAPSLDNRICKAASLWKRDPGALIICSGGAIKSSIFEAQAMHDGLRARGVVPTHIIREMYAATTDENAVNTFRILKQVAHLGPCRLTLVVEPYQALRAMRAFLRVRDAHKFSQDYIIDLAPAAALPVRKSSPYHYLASKPRSCPPTQNGTPWPLAAHPQQYLEADGANRPVRQWRRPALIKKGEAPIAWHRHAGGPHRLDTVCPPGARLDLERVLAKKLRLMYPWRRPARIAKGEAPVGWYRHGGGPHPLDTVCPPGTRLDLERLLTEKLKLDLGH